MPDKKVWLKNGRVVMSDGKVVLCGNCPCEPCTLQIYVSGWDRNRTSIGEPTHHIFDVEIAGAVIRSIQFGYGDIVDLGGVIRQTGDSTFTVELDNQGTASSDSFDFRVDMTLPGMPVTAEDISVEHRFFGSAQQSEYTVELSGSCLSDEEFE